MVDQPFASTLLNSATRPPGHPRTHKGAGGKTWTRTRPRSAGLAARAGRWHGRRGGTRLGQPRPSAARLRRSSASPPGTGPASLLARRGAGNGLGEFAGFYGCIGTKAALSAWRAPAPPGRMGAGLSPGLGNAVETSNSRQLCGSRGRGFPADPATSLAGCRMAAVSAAWWPVAGVRGGRGVVGRRGKQGTAQRRRRGAAYPGGHAWLDRSFADAVLERRICGRSVPGGRIVRHQRQGNRPRSGKPVAGRVRVRLAGTKHPGPR